MKRLATLLLLLPLCGPANAQCCAEDSLFVLFESDPGTRPAQIFTDGFESGDLSRLDANGDDTVDLIVRRNDDQGNLQDLRILDGRSREVIWEVRDVATTLGITSNMDFWGFADANADGQREAIFSGDTVLRAYDLNPNLVSYQIAATTGSIRLLGADDLTGDTFEEIVLFLPETRQVQVWTKAD